MPIVAIQLGKEGREGLMTWPQKYEMYVAAPGILVLKIDACKQTHRAARPLNERIRHSAAALAFYGGGCKLRQ